MIKNAVMIDPIAKKLEISLVITKILLMITIKGSKIKNKQMKNETEN